MITQARQQIRALVDDSNPVEAPLAYYALFHPAERSALFTKTGGDGQPLGFVGRFQTGADLFRPLVVLKCPSPEVAAQLLDDALIAGRPYIFFAPLNQLAMVGGSLRVENERILQVYVFELAGYKPEVNVLVQHKNAPDGTPRAEISNSGFRAVAGVNWKSPGFAEIYVHTDPQARNQGWGRSVVAALTERLLREGVRPVYLVENNNEASRHLVEGLGFVDSGSRYVVADTIYVGHPLS